jgi:hypothetical protein
MAAIERLFIDTKLCCPGAIIKRTSTISLLAKGYLNAHQIHQKSVQDQGQFLDNQGTYPTGKVGNHPVR